jgi:hypothetical protein
MESNEPKPTPKLHFTLFSSHLGAIGKISMRSSVMASYTPSDSAKAILSKDWSVRWSNALLDSLHLDTRTCGFPIRLLNRRLLGILSSHPTRNAFRNPQWQQALDSILLLAKRESAVILYPHQAPYGPAIEFACDRFGIESLAICTHANEPPLDKNSTDPPHPCRLDLHCQIHSTKEDPKNSIIPSEDLAVCALADRLVALNVSPGGKVASVLEKRLRCPQISPSTLWICAESSPSRSKKIDQKNWSDLGAILWFPGAPPNPCASSWSCSRRAIPSTLQLAGPIPSPLLNSDRYLIHTTRARQSEWPDQSQRDLLDEAFRFDWNPNPSPLETLHRIVVSQRLIATSTRKRGALSSVSLTQNPLAELLCMRAFQSHLARWDWEPYGIAILKSALMQLGCRPVRYLAKSEIAQLELAEQAFCQPLPDRPKDRDWTGEQEWRYPDDLRLATLPANSAFLFVPYEWESRALAHDSRWPVFSLM